MNELFENYYFQNLLYCLIVIFLSLSIIKERKKKNTYLKDRMKSLDLNDFAKISFLFLFIRCLLEILDYYFKLFDNSIDFILSFETLFVFFIVRCIIAPIFEEIIFRFGLFEFISNRIKPLLSIIITSFIFSILHGYDIKELLLLFLFSIFWNYLYYKKQNLIYPICLHFIFNFMSFTTFFNINYLFYIILSITSLIIWLVFIVKKKVVK